MILHSIAKIDDIFPASGRESLLLPCKYGWVDCVEEGNQRRIRRLISTNPAAYLDKLYTPGNFYKQ